MTQKSTDTDLLQWLVSEGYVSNLRRVQGGAWVFVGEDEEGNEVRSLGKTWRQAMNAAREAAGDGQ